MATSSAENTTFQRKRSISKHERQISHQTEERTERKGHVRPRSISHFYKAMILAVIVLVSGMIMDMEKSFSSRKFLFWSNLDSESGNGVMANAQVSADADEFLTKKEKALQDLLLPSDSQLLDWDSFDSPNANNAVQALKKEFKSIFGRYGRSLLTRTVSLFPKSTSTNNTTINNNQIQTLAQALHQLGDHPSIVVAGNGAAAGYGNYRAQAYSNKLLVLLKRLYPTSTITNLAVDQTTEFPSSFCLAQYSPTMNVVIWDYVGSTSQRLEAFLRTSLLQGARIFLGRASSTTSDTESMKRVLQHYCPQETIPNEPLDNLLRFKSCIWLENLESVTSDFRSLAELHQDLPPGFDQLETSFGTGRKPAQHHELDHLPSQRPMLLTTKQHDLVAWLFFWPFLSAFQHASREVSSQKSASPPSKSNAKLPPTVELQNSETCGLILGHSTVSSCFSTYDYVARDALLNDVPSADVHIPANLPSLITSQTIGSSKQVLKPKFGSAEKGWILDMDEASKRDKKTMQHDVLQHQHESNDEPSFYGMVDWKQAYFGVYLSGVLKISIPLTTNFGTKKKSLSLLRTGKQREIRQKVKALILCQSDVPMNDKVQECSWRRDVAIRVNGERTKSEPLDPSYGVVISTRGAQQQGHVQPLCRRILLGNVTAESTSLDLEVEVTNPRIIWHRKHSTPCSLSHILLEEERPS